MVVNMYAHAGVKFIYFFFLWRCGLTRAMASAFLRIRDHTQRRTIFNSTPTDEWSFRRRDLYLITHKSHKRQTSMPPAGFEQTIQARKRPLLHDLDRTATGVDISLICDKSVTTQNLAFFFIIGIEKTYADEILTGMVWKFSLQNSTLESSCVVVALIESYSTSKPLKSFLKNHTFWVVTLLSLMSDICTGGRTIYIFIRLFQIYCHRKYAAVFSA